MSFGRKTHCINKSSFCKQRVPQFCRLCVLGAELDVAFWRDLTIPIPLLPDFCEMSKKVCDFFDFVYVHLFCVIFRMSGDVRLHTLPRWTR